MDNMLLQELSQSIGVKLTVRDNHQLERDTLEMQVEKLIKKQRAARVATCEVNEEAAIRAAGKLD